jgi:hypothetical protein
MHYFVQDLIGLVAATPLAILLVILPGFGLVRLLSSVGLVPRSGANCACYGLVLGPALLPAADALLLRWLGFPATFLLHVALAAGGCRMAFEAACRLRGRWWLAIAFCWLLAAWANVDFDWDGRLFQPITINDGVEHAAVVAALVRSGVPLHDPFFARPGTAGYYYYFYIGPALIHWIGRPLIDSRMAFAAGTFVTYLAFGGLTFIIADAAALIPSGCRRRFLRMTLLLCCVSGLDLLPGLWILLRTGGAYPQLDWWSEEVRWTLTSVLWVPHHVTALIAVYTGCLVLALNGSGRLLTRAVIAGLAFATAFGCSAWIAVAAFPILLIWWIYERIENGRDGMWALPLAAIAALMLSLPQVADIRAGRTSAGPLLAFYMRPVGPNRVLPHGVWQWIVHLAVTPGGYLIEFGIFALGAIAFVTRGRVAESRGTPIGRLLLVSAPVALLLVTFVRSAILYNDFGWRSIWFAELPALLWTASFLGSRPGLLRKSPLWSTALGLGLAAVVWDITGLRLIRPHLFFNYVNAEPRLDYDVRGAYYWADRNLPRDMLVQHNPVQAYRALDFGLYSDRPVAVADTEARLFGANQNAVARRIADLQPIFEHSMPASEFRRRASAGGTGAVLLTSADPLWRESGGPPRDWRCAYRSADTCIMVVERPR